MCPGHMDNPYGAPDMPAIYIFYGNGSIKHESMKNVVMAKATFFLQELKTISVPNIKHAKEKCK
ncbi:MAG: hypothetical protein MR459_06450 [Enterocloster aldenensis]|nr:hypothetical protein [Enterocloster aldenensis]